MDALYNALGEICTHAISKEIFPGCVVSAAIGDEQPLVAAFGHLTYEKDIPMGDGKFFDSASITKLFVALGIMKLVENGKLFLSSRLDQFFSFAEEGVHTAFTIEDLLTCRVYFDLPPELDSRKWLLAGKSGDEWREMFFKKAKAVRMPPYAPKYTNIPALLNGWVIEKVTGTDLESALNELVLEPLSLFDTIFDPAGKIPSERDRKLLIVPTEAGLPLGMPSDEMARIFRSTPIGVSGLYPTIRDLGEVAHVLATGANRQRVRLLSEETHCKMLGLYARLPNSFGFALGVFKFAEGYLRRYPDFCREAVLMPSYPGSLVVGCPATKGMPSISFAFLTNTNCPHKPEVGPDGNFPIYWVRRAMLEALLDWASNGRR